MLNNFSQENVPEVVKKEVKELVNGLDKAESSQAVIQAQVEESTLTPTLVEDVSIPAGASTVLPAVAQALPAVETAIPSVKTAFSGVATALPGAPSTLPTSSAQQEQEFLDKKDEKILENIAREINSVEKEVDNLASQVPEKDAPIKRERALIPKYKKVPELNEPGQIQKV